MTGARSRRIPRLVPVAPTSGEPTQVESSPLWIGSGRACTVRVFLPGIADKQASIVERQDGYYLSPFPGAQPPRLGGRPVTTPTLLADGDVIELAPAARYEFVTGEPRPEPVKEPEPVFVTEEQPRKSRWPKRRRRRRVGGTAGFPLWAMLGIGIVLILAVGAGIYLIQVFRPGGQEDEVRPPLTEVQGRIYDSLMLASTASIERGATLLDLGLRDAALGEFGRAIANFETSPLRHDPWVRPRVDALAQAVVEILRGKGLNIPPEMQTTGRSVVTPLSARLDVPGFTAGVEQVRTAFLARFRSKFTVTGADHPEHLTLYGRGGALDIRTNGLAGEEVQYLVAGFRARGIRVKDFSKDEILQAQIAAAIRAGLPDRAGTGRHLHIDRYADRRDRWTVR